MVISNSETATTLFCITATEVVLNHITATTVILYHITATVVISIFRNDTSKYSRLFSYKLIVVIATINL